MSDLYSDYDDSPYEYSEDEYNSGDDEFLAFHDADIEAQVRAEIAKMKIKRAMAESSNEARLQFIDEAQVLQIKEEQIKVVGSQSLYEKINKNFLEDGFDRYFAKEQFDLYSWREDFFHSRFPEDCWFTDGADDSHNFDTVPYQITKQFDKVVALACSLQNMEDKVYFVSNEHASAKARTLYDTNTVMYYDSFLEKDFLDSNNLSFSDAAHVIVTVFQSSPLKLEHLAMKKVLEYDLPLSEVPTELEEKSTTGMFNLNDEIPDYINDEGKETYEILQKNYGFTS